MQACSQEEPVGTSPSSSPPPYCPLESRTFPEVMEMVATWRKENIKLPLKRAEWVWPLLLVTSASAWQTLELVPLCRLNPRPKALYPTQLPLPRPSGAPLFQGHLASVW